MMAIYWCRDLSQAKGLVAFSASLASINGWTPYPTSFFRARANPGAAASMTFSATQKARRK